MLKRSRAKRLASSPPSCAAQLDDDVAPGIGVAREQQGLEVSSSSAMAPAAPSISLDHLTVLAGRVGQHGLGGLVVGACLAQLAPGRDDLAELLVASREIAQSVGVGGRGRLGEARARPARIPPRGSSGVGSSTGSGYRAPASGLRPGGAGGLRTLPALDFALRSPVAALEALDAPTRVDQLLLAGEDGWHSLHSSTRSSGLVEWVVNVLPQDSAPWRSRSWGGWQPSSVLKDRVVQV